MGEREHQSEIDFWARHSIKDDCPWERKPDLGWFDVIPESIAEFKKIPERLMVFKKLQKFLRMKQRELARCLRDGEAFRLSDFPIGTVVRFSRDKEDRSYVLGLFGGGRKSFQDEWAILIQRQVSGGYYDVLAGFSGKDLAEREAAPLDYQHVLMEDITIGEVRHYRYIEDNTSLIPIDRLLGFHRDEQLSRVNWLEIWKFGSALRKTVTQRVPEMNFLPERVGI